MILSLKGLKITISKLKRTIKIERLYRNKRKRKPKKKKIRKMRM
jgi:hypothetical protein